jgi:hypothetical protein
LLRRVEDDNTLVVSIGHENPTGRIDREAVWEIESHIDSIVTG